MTNLKIVKFLLWSGIFCALSQIVTSASMPKTELSSNKEEIEKKMDDLLKRIMNSHPNLKERLKAIDKDKLQELKDIWRGFKTKFAKEYADTNAEDVAMANVAERVRSIVKSKLSEKKMMYKTGLNSFSDLSVEDFRSKILGLKVSESKMKSIRKKALMGTKPKNVDLYQFVPKNVDLRKSGLISPVKNQGNCGGCYSFATVGVLEAVYRLAYNKTPVTFSEQQIIDCSRKFGNNGCGGGLMEDSFKYVEQFGIEKESDYKYKTSASDCKYNGNKTIAIVTTIRAFEPGDEASIVHTLQFIPVAIGVDASSSEFQNYAGGIFDSDQCDKNFLNHAVLLVGYGSEKVPNSNKTVGYWIIKNSWGNSWGEKGYMRMLRNCKNFCGVASMASTAIL